jgi:hypothetical protein
MAVVYYTLSQVNESYVHNDYLITHTSQICMLFHDVGTVHCGTLYTLCAC